MEICGSTKNLTLAYFSPLCFAAGDYLAVIWRVKHSWYCTGLLTRSSSFRGIGSSPIPSATMPFIANIFWVRDIHQPAKDVCRKRMCGSGDLKPAPMVDVAQ